MFRSHGTDAPREIWRFGDKGELFYDTIAKYIRLRYQLLPYIYSVASEAATSGAAVMRPLAMAFPKDIATHDLIDQFLFGPSMMVCPVTKPMYFEKGSIELKGASNTRQGYLPSGPGWFDFWTGMYFSGAKTV